MGVFLLSIFQEIVDADHSTQVGFGIVLKEYGRVFLKIRCQKRLQLGD